jgi:hypothetical protein
MPPVYTIYVEDRINDSYVMPVFASTKEELESLMWETAESNYSDFDKSRYMLLSSKDSVSIVSRDHRDYRLTSCHIIQLDDLTTFLNKK